MRIKEDEIRPEKIFNEYLKLAEADTIKYFSKVESKEIKCPVCNNRGNEWVKKSIFTYKICDLCLSIFVSPRPSKEAFESYYKDSPSTKFWATKFYKITEASRREKLWKPKAKMVKKRILKYSNNVPIEYIVDIGGGYGVFAEEIKNIMNIKTILVEPSIHLASICREKGLEVIEKFMEDIQLEDLPFGRKCYVSFELFEHLHNPSKFLNVLYKQMSKGDIFIFTTLSGMGIDIQLLKEKSKSVSPPHHLNFLNPKSVSSLLNKNGFNVLEAITPGRLDIDILSKNQHHIKDPFWSNIFKYSNQKELLQIQDFISSSGLSSHMMITCVK